MSDFERQTLTSAAEFRSASGDMDQRVNYKVEAAVRACRQACLGTMTPLTNYWLAIELLSEDPAWSRSEISELRRRFVESMIDDAVRPPASRSRSN